MRFYRFWQSTSRCQTSALLQVLTEYRQLSNRCAEQQPTCLLHCQQECLSTRWWWSPREFSCFGRTQTTRWIDTAPSSPAFFSLTTTSWFSLTSVTSCWRWRLWEISGKWWEYHFRTRLLWGCVSCRMERWPLLLSSRASSLRMSADRSPSSRHGCRLLSSTRGSLPAEITTPSSSAAGDPARMQRPLMSSGETARSWGRSSTATHCPTWISPTTSTWRGSRTF